MSVKRILVIDEEEYLCDLLKKILERNNKYELMIALDGKSGLEKCIREKPDLLILDFVLPAMMGDKVLESIRKHRELDHMPIILMSGVGEDNFFPGVKAGTKAWEDVYVEVNPGRESSVVMRWKRAPSEIVQQYKVFAYMEKPFSKEALLKAVDDVFDNVKVI